MVLRGGWGKGAYIPPRLVWPLIGLLIGELIRASDRSSDKEIDKSFGRSSDKSFDKETGIHICIIEQSYLFYWPRRHDEYDPTIVCIRMI